MTTPLPFINLCLIPDEGEERGRVFTETEVAFSQMLNEAEPSQYCLSLDPKKKNHSLNHATLMHATAPSNDKMVEFGLAIAPLLGTEIEVETTGMIFLPRHGNWHRDIHTKVKEADPLSKTMQSIIWTDIVLTAELRDLQNKIAVLVRDILGDTHCLTGTGNRYRPHFSDWLQTDETAHLPLDSFTIETTGQFTNVPCKVALGSVAGVGLVQKTSYNAPDILDLAHFTL